MKPIFAALLLGLMVVVVLSFSGCIQPKEAPVVSEKVASEEWKPDGVEGENEYARSMVLVGPSRQGYTGGEMEISWKNDQEFLYMALNATANGWLAIGFEPLEWMKNADMILGSVQGGKVTVLDEYCTGNYGPHIEDTLLGGTNDILESGGSKVAGRTIIEFKRKLNTGDRFDKAFIPGQAISVIWASSQGSDASIKHDVAYGEGILTLTAERTGVAPVAALTLRETQGMLFIWEEEKTARDLYTSLYEKNNQTIFLNLVRSEQNHMDQAKAIIDKYGLQAQIKDVPGIFGMIKPVQEIHDRLRGPGTGIRSGCTAGGC